MQRYIVEFLGTLFLTFIILATNNYLAIGAALAIAVLLGGAISGGAFNPAVAVAYMYAGKLSSTDTIVYIIVEIIGAILGYEIVKMTTKTR
jgi:glycerol uptake facilitator-like aquaporin